MTRGKGAAESVLASQRRQEIGVVPTRGLGQKSLGYPLPWLPGACPEVEQRLKEEE